MRLGQSEIGRLFLLLRDDFKIAASVSLESTSFIVVAVFLAVYIAMGRLGIASGSRHVAKLSELVRCREKEEKIVGKSGIYVVVGTNCFIPSNPYLRG